MPRTILDARERQSRLLLHTYNRLLVAVHEGDIDLLDWLSTLDALSDCINYGEDDDMDLEWRISKSGKLTYI